MKRFKHVSPSLNNIHWQRFIFTQKALRNVVKFDLNVWSLSLSHTLKHFFMIKNFRICKENEYDTWGSNKVNFLFNGQAWNSLNSTNVPYFSLRKFSHARTVYIVVAVIQVIPTAYFSWRKTRVWVFSQRSGKWFNRSRDEWNVE